MRGRYFRYLFENQNGGLFHIGSVYDKEQQKITNYVYMVENYIRNARKERITDVYQKEDNIPEIIDILVMGCYTANYINKLIHIVQTHEVGTLILPYLAPIQRLVLAEEIKSGGIEGKEAARFLQAPYHYLQKFGIGNIYFLFGNGSAIMREPEELETGIHFEAANKELMQLVREMEGYTIPLVRAGYIIENGWLFYFGVYGLDIQILSNFTRDYFSHIENIHVISENINEDYVNQMKRLIQEYLKKFGSSPATTVVMYEGPLYALPSENENFMTEKEFSRKERSEERIKCRGDSRCTCTIRCLYSRDYDNVQNRRGRDGEEIRFGILLLGNANLNRYLPEILVRFRQIRFRIRGISVPNCGSGEDWNHHILDVSDGKSRMYWICAKHGITSAGVVSDIVLSGMSNRFLAIDEEAGCCLSGYIIPKEDIE